MLVVTAWGCDIQWRGPWVGAMGGLRQEIVDKWAQDGAHELTPWDRTLGLPMVLEGYGFTVEGTLLSVFEFHGELR